MKKKTITLVFTLVMATNAYSLNFGNEQDNSYQYIQQCYKVGEDGTGKSVGEDGTGKFQYCQTILMSGIQK